MRRTNQDDRQHLIQGLARVYPGQSLDMPFLIRAITTGKADNAGQCHEPGHPARPTVVGLAWSRGPRPGQAQHSEHFFYLFWDVGGQCLLSTRSHARLLDEVARLKNSFTEKWVNCMTFPSVLKSCFFPAFPSKEVLVSSPSERTPLVPSHSLSRRPTFCLSSIYAS